MPPLLNTAVKNVCTINTFEKLLNILFSEVYCHMSALQHYWAKFPHSPIHHYTSIYGALLFSVSPVRCTCIIKYGAVRKFFPLLFSVTTTDMSLYEVLKLFPR